jgi:hypothetical protein
MVFQGFADGIADKPSTLALNHRRTYARVGRSNVDPTEAANGKSRIALGVSRTEAVYADGLQPPD